MSDNCSCAAHQQPRCAHFRMGNCPDKGNIIKFAKKMPTGCYGKGNGALEKMREYFSTEHNWPDHIPAMTEADYFLAWLWMEGFRIVPVFTPPTPGVS